MKTASGLEYRNTPVDYVALTVGALIGWFGVRALAKKLSR